ncbi:MAG: hypothetical protein ACRDYD_09365, partial [Acidimicrobiales bacterium]
MRTARARAARARAARWLELVGLVARREMRERSSARSYKLTTVILVLAVAASVVISALLRGHESVQRVGLVGADRPAMAAIVAEAGRVVDAEVRPVPEKSLASAEAGLRSGSLAAVLVGGKEVLVKQSPGAGG